MSYIHWTKQVWNPKFMLALRLAKWFDEVNLDQSLLSGLLGAIIELDGSFGLELRLGVYECGFGSKSWVAWYFTWE